MEAMRGYVIRVAFIAFKVKQEMIDEYLFISALLVSYNYQARKIHYSLSISKDCSHRI